MTRTPSLSQVFDAGAYGRVLKGERKERVEKEVSRLPIEQYNIRAELALTRELAVEALDQMQQAEEDGTKEQKLMANARLLHLLNQVKNFASDGAKIERVCNDQFSENMSAYVVEQVLILAMQLFESEVPPTLMAEFCNRVRGVVLDSSQRAIEGTSYTQEDVEASVRLMAETVPRVDTAEDTTLENRDEAS